MDASFLTVLVTDFVGSTAGFDRQGDAADARRREHLGSLRRPIAQHGGRDVAEPGDILASNLVRSRR